MPCSLATPLCLPPAIFSSLVYKRLGKKHPPKGIDDCARCWHVSQLETPSWIHSKRAPHSSPSWPQSPYHLTSSDPSNLRLNKWKRGGEKKNLIEIYRRLNGRVQSTTDSVRFNQGRDIPTFLQNNNLAMHLFGWKRDPLYCTVQSVKKHSCLLISLCSVIECWEWRLICMICNKFAPTDISKRLKRFERFWPDLNRQLNQGQ